MSYNLRPRKPVSYLPGARVSPPPAPRPATVKTMPRPRDTSHIVEARARPGDDSARAVVLCPPYNTSLCENQMTLIIDYVAVTGPTAYTLRDYVSHLVDRGDVKYRREYIVTRFAEDVPIDIDTPLKNLNLSEYVHLSVREVF